MTPVVLAPKLMAKVLESNDHPYRLTKPWHFRMSSIGYCANKLVQDHLHPPETTGNSMRTAMGTMFHRIQEDMIRGCPGVKVAGTEQLVKLTIKTDHGPIVLWGHVDVTLAVGKDNIPVDFKNLSDFSFEDNLKKLSREYRWQILGYARALGAPYGILSLWCVFGSAGRAAIDDVVVENTDKEWAQVVKHLTHVVKCRMKKKHGKREYHKDKFPCTYCTHRVPCWGLTQTQLNNERVVLDKAKVPPEVRANIRALSKMIHDEKMYQAHVDGSQQRADLLARELLVKLKTAQVVVPGRFTVRRWGQAVRIIPEK